MDTPRRDFVKAAGAAALTTSLFTGKLKGANERVSAAFIGVGRMGSSNLQHAMNQENLVPVAICDVFQPNLDAAMARAQAKHQGVRAVKDFRDILADKSIDVVCISTPDHWHAYMMVEACKAGKDVYVEKPVSVTVDEGVKMVQAARKYNRVVQAGTMQRSGKHFQEAAELVRSGKIGKVSFVRTWNVGYAKPEGIGNPADGTAPATLDWDMWLGPAPKRTYNANRFGIDQEQLNRQRWFPHFRWFWDYAGGMMTDWGVHLLDIVQMAFDEPMPTAVTALGGKFFFQDNRETPDTLQVTYEYPGGMLATYEHRNNNGFSPFENAGYGILYQGTDGVLFVDRSRYKLVPRGTGESKPEPTEVKSSNNMNDAHWANFLECVRTRQKPISDIEVCHKSSSVCHLGNIALRAKSRLDFDAQRFTVTQSDARKFLSREERKPWVIKV